MPRFAETFIEPANDPRADVPADADEKTLLAGFLQWQRQTLVLKCSNLGPEALAERSVTFSGLSLLGLVRHLADVERGWFRRRLAGQDADPHFGTAEHLDAAFDDAAPDADLVAEAWRLWQDEVDYAERFVAEAPSLDLEGVGPTPYPITLRWVLVHMIEEYARHNGHADLLRQGIDGAVGE